MLFDVPRQSDELVRAALVPLIALASLGAGAWKAGTCKTFESELTGGKVLDVPAGLSMK